MTYKQLNLQVIEEYENLTLELLHKEVRVSRKTNLDSPKFRFKHTPTKIKKWNKKYQTSEIVLSNIIAWIDKTIEAIENYELLEDYSKTTFYVKKLKHQLLWKWRDYKETTITLPREKGQIIFEALDSIRNSSVQIQYAKSILKDYFDFK